jgi:hypothetical protein
MSKEQPEILKKFLEDFSKKGKYKVPRGLL